jgi:hypothetical protein
MIKSPEIFLRQLPSEPEYLRLESPSKSQVHDYVQTISCNFGTPDCGAHGTLTPPCSCVCDSGWATDANQDFSNYKYCNVTTAALQGSQTNTIIPGCATTLQNRLYPKAKICFVKCCYCSAASVLSPSEQKTLTHSLMDTDLPGH